MRGSCGESDAAGCRFHITDGLRRKDLRKGIISAQRELLPERTCEAVAILMGKATEGALGGQATGAEKCLINIGRGTVHGRDDVQLEEIRQKAIGDIQDRGDFGTIVHGARGKGRLSILQNHDELFAFGLLLLAVPEVDEIWIGDDPDRRRWNEVEAVRGAKLHHQMAKIGGLSAAWSPVKDRQPVGALGKGLDKTGMPIEEFGAVIERQLLLGETELGLHRDCKGVEIPAAHAKKVIGAELRCLLLVCHKVTLQETTQQMACTKSWSVDLETPFVKMNEEPAILAEDHMEPMLLLSHPPAVRAEDAFGEIFGHRIDVPA